jgi:flagellar biosynthesis protein FlhA
MAAEQSLSSQDKTLSSRDKTLQIISAVSMPAVVIILLMMIVIPLPPLMLDFFFTFNLASALIVLMSSVYVRRPLDFAVFPTVLLVMTLLRLALNVASTRVVLISGHTGTDAAGKVIEAFGDFVVGGNFSVGLVVFLILVIINFIVVTKGAERISEVTARFTLDAMPGKQMAIDAELNAGMMSQEVAKARRDEIARESSFYGAMDGASKFVKGDAIAGILILIINIVGGLSIGMLQHDLSASVAAQNYILLMIGDGLVAQIPSLMLSSAAALIVTRGSESEGVGNDIGQQVLGNPKVFIVSSIIIGMLGLVPAMPNLLILGIAGVLAAIAFFKTAASKQLVSNALQEQEQESSEPLSKDLGWEDVVSNDVLGLDLGYRLVPLADIKGETGLLARMKTLRRRISQDYGFLLPQIHIRDNLMLAPNGYSITLHEVPIAEGTVEVGMEMAINPGDARGELEGIAGKEPAYGLDATWIPPSERDNAQLMGFTVVDASSVIATHMTEVLRQHVHELIGHDDAQQLLDALGNTAPRLVENLVPKALPLSSLLRVLQNLLEEGVPIKDFRAIAEALAANATNSQNPDDLTAQARIALGRTICQSLAGMGDELEVVTLDMELEQLLLNISGARADPLPIEPGIARWLASEIQGQQVDRERQGAQLVMLVPDGVRMFLYRFVKKSSLRATIMSFSEIPASRHLKVVATLSKPAVGE